MVRSLGPRVFVLMGTEQLLATHSKSVETLSLNTNSLRSVLDYLTRIPISGIILVGTAGVAGMFMGQSTSTLTLPSFPQFGELTIFPTRGHE